MLRIDSVQPTVLFRNGQQGLLQAVDVVIENDSDEVTVQLRAQFGIQGSEATVCPIAVRQGKEKYQILVPDICDPVPAEFTLEVGGQTQDRHSIEWTPRKHWQVHMIPIAHHDLGYTNTIESVLQTYCEIYEDVLRFCDETDDWPEESRFRYMVEETWSIQHFIQNSSEETLEKLGKYIRQGRIEIPALFGNQISGLCGHEELVRLMYPSFRIHREFGAPIRSGSITDVPGLSWGLPTVLAGAGVKYFFAGLPTYFRWGGRNDIHTFWDEDAILREHGRPDAFRWRGPDGSEILVFYQGSYGCWSPSNHDDIMDGLPPMLDDMDAQGCPFSVMRYGGYGCGDNTRTDIIVSQLVKEWNSQWAYPKLVVSTNSMFFEELDKQCHDLRVFSGELPHTDYAVGAVSSAKETSINRVTHDKLQSAEKFATVALLLNGHPSFRETIDIAYDNMLLYDEHTWGSAYQVGHRQDFAWSEKAQYAYRAASLTDHVLTRSVGTIADSVSRSQGQHLVVFNSLSFERTDLVRIPKFRVDGPFKIVDTQTGDTVAHQVVELKSPQAPVSHAAGRYARGQFADDELFDLVFVAKNVPSMGYKSYQIAPTEGSELSSGVVVHETSLENRFYKVVLNPQTGTVESLYDKELQREMVDQEAVHELNQLVVRWVKTGEQESPVKAEIRKGESGPVYGSLVVSSQVAGCPQLTQEIILYDELKRIDLANRVLKDSTPTMEVYFAFPFKVEPPDFRFEATNSVIKPLRDQFPGSNSNYYSVQHWADVSDGNIGVTLSPIDSHLVEFGGLWPCYVSQAHHGVTPPGFGADFVKQEDLTKGHMVSFAIDSNFRTNFQATQQGDMLFRYSITTHKGSWRQGKPRDFGWSIGNPLVPAPIDGEKEGALPESASFCHVNQQNVLLSALKEAEDGRGIILRLIETEGKPVDVTVTLPHISISQATRTNLVEEDAEELPAQEHSFSVPVDAFGISTVRIQPG